MDILINFYSLRSILSSYKAYQSEFNHYSVTKLIENYIFELTTNLCVNSVDFHNRIKSCYDILILPSNCYTFY